MDSDRSYLFNTKVEYVEFSGVQARARCWLHSITQFNALRYFRSTASFCLKTFDPASLLALEARVSCCAAPLSTGKWSLSRRLYLKRSKGCGGLFERFDLAVFARSRLQLL
jgi:hypothetical protein